MTRRYGRSPLGTRLVEKTPCGRWQTTTFLGALRVEGFIAPLTVEGTINGPLFRAWVEQHLAPVLKPGDFVVMDNLSSHKVAGGRWSLKPKWRIQATAMTPLGYSGGPRSYEDSQSARNGLGNISAPIRAPSDLAESCGS